MNLFAKFIIFCAENNIIIKMVPPIPSVVNGMSSAKPAICQINEVGEEGGQKD